ncbi:hypothetical protein MTO96_010564 [Rhipicephalus appendiculatus]
MKHPNGDKNNARPVPLLQITSDGLGRTSVDKEKKHYRFFMDSEMADAARQRRYYERLRGATRLDKPDVASGKTGGSGRKEPDDVRRRRLVQLATTPAVTTLQRDPAGRDFVRRGGSECAEEVGDKRRTFPPQDTDGRARHSVSGPPTGVGAAAARSTKKRLSAAVHATTTLALDAGVVAAAVGKKRTASVRPEVMLGSAATLVGTGPAPPSSTTNAGGVMVVDAAGARRAGAGGTLDDDDAGRRQATVTFTHTKNICYRALSLLCAVPLALIVGISFACLSFQHIWCIGPADPPLPRQLSRGAPVHAHHTGVVLRALLLFRDGPGAQQDPRAAPSKRGQASHGVHLAWLRVTRALAVKSRYRTQRRCTT